MELESNVKYDPHDDNDLKGEPSPINALAVVTGILRFSRQDQYCSQEGHEHQMEGQWNTVESQREPSKYIVT